MYTRAAYLMVIVLLGVIAYFVLPGRTEAPSNDEIERSEQTTLGEVRSSGGTLTEKQTVETDQETVEISGILTGFVAVNESTGTTYTEATINDGTEILRVNLRELNLSAPAEEVYADRINTTIKVTGYVERGTFMATEIK